jgi:hypothetical protein
VEVSRGLTYLLQLPRLCKGNLWFFGYFCFFFVFFFAFGTEITCRSSRYCRFNTSDRHEVLSALLDFLVFFLFVFQLTRRLPSTAGQLRVLATSSLVAHSFLDKVICFAVPILWKIRSVGEKSVSIRDVDRPFLVQTDRET